MARRWMAWFGCALMALTAGCDEPDAVLIVNLRTDLRAGVEYDRVEVEATSDGMPVRRVDGPTVTMSDTGAVVRLAELADVARGIWQIRVRLFNGAAEAGTGLVQLELRGGSAVVTVIITRDCAGVACPGDGNPGDTACLAGGCVDPRCSPETPDLCPEPECTSDSTCLVETEAPACATGLCLAGVCAVQLDDRECGAGMCLPTGCTMEMDAGPADAGPADAGPADAGPADAGASVVPERLWLGGSHSWVRMSDGEVRCWGDNSLAQLSFGGADVLEPVVPAGVRDVDVAPGGLFGCGFEDGGAVACWGFGSLGQLGDGMGVDHATPSQIPMFGPPSSGWPRAGRMPARATRWGEPGVGAPTCPARSGTEPRTTASRRRSSPDSTLRSRSTSAAPTPARFGNRGSWPAGARTTSGSWATGA